MLLNTSTASNVNRLAATDVLDKKQNCNLYVRAQVDFNDHALDCPGSMCLNFHFRDAYDFHAWMQFGAHVEMRCLREIPIFTIQLDQPADVRVMFAV